MGTRPRDKHDPLALELNCKSERDKANRRKQRDGGNGEPHVLLPSRAVWGAAERSPD